MGTLVCFHAHPDDEAIATGGSMARAADEGHRVVLVVATNGEHGEVPDDLAPGESLADRRRAEVDASAAVLGVARVAWLGYSDSGMTGWEQNHHPDAFWQAPVDDAAERLAAILREEHADVLTTYDWHGGYGHPDHIQVHRVGHRAAELAGTPRVVESTMNRDHIGRMMRMAAEMQAAGESHGGPDPDEFDPNAPADDGNPFGTLEAEISLAVDVGPWIDRKRRSIAAHRSQVSDGSFFLSMPAEAFLGAFGTEWFIEHRSSPDAGASGASGDGSGPRVGWLFE